MSPCWHRVKFRGSSEGHYEKKRQTQNLRTHSPLHRLPPLVFRTARRLRPFYHLSSPCAARVPATGEKNNMPWRHLTLTDTDVIYPANWDMEARQRFDVSESIGPTELPSGRIVTQDLFAQSAAPKSHAAPSLPGIDEEEALPDGTLPYSALRTETLQDPLLQCSSGRHTLSPLVDLHSPTAISNLARGLHSRTQPDRTVRSSRPVDRTAQHTGVPTTSPVNLAHSGTSLARKRTPLGPYSRPTPRVPEGS